MKKENITQNCNDNIRFYFVFFYTYRRLVYFACVDVCPYIVNIWSQLILFSCLYSFFKIGIGRTLRMF